MLFPRLPSYSLCLHVSSGVLCRVVQLYSHPAHTTQFVFLAVEKHNYKLSEKKCQLVKYYSHISNLLTSLSFRAIKITLIWPPLPSLGLPFNVITSEECTGLVVVLVGDTSREGTRCCWRVFFETFWMPENLRGDITFCRLSALEPSSPSRSPLVFLIDEVTSKCKNCLEDCTLNLDTRLNKTFQIVWIWWILYKW